MSTFLQDELGVAMSGVMWDVNRYKLWQSTRPDIILFTPKQPALARSLDTGRYQVAVSQFHQQKDDTYKVTGGSAIFTITSAIQQDPKGFEELKQQWLAQMSAVGPKPPANPKFIPLNVQKGEATVLINPASGTPDPAHNNKDIGTPGGTNSFLVNLTELGAQEWAQGIRERKSIPAGVKIMYEYLRMMPEVGARVTLHAKRVFSHISAHMKLDVNGFWFGGSANIEAMWEKLSREGILEIEFIGIMPPELEPIRADLVNTFATQAREMMFKSLFEPKPNVQPAQAGDTSGIFGGANFAFKYRREEEVTDIGMTLKFKGWTWLKASMDADLSALFTGLDESYVNDVNTQVSFPAAIVVDADPLLANVALSWSTSEGAIPRAPVFGAEGGNAEYIVTSQRPDDVKIRYKAKVNFEPPRWPVIEASGEATTREGGNQIVVKPSAWVGRHMIYMFVRDGDRIIPPQELTDDDYLVANVSYQGAHLKSPIKDSARITPLEALEFSYPLSPGGDRGKAKFSAFGVIDGKLIRSKAEQEIKFDEDAVFLLADKNGIELVSQSSVLPESDRLAASLLAAAARPVVSNVTGVPATVRDEMERKGGKGARRIAEKQPDYALPDMPLTPDGEITGTTRAIEVGEFGFAILVDTDQGTKRIPVKNERLLEPLDEGRRRVRVRMDATGQTAERITVEL